MYRKQGDSCNLKKHKSVWLLWYPPIYINFKCYLSKLEYLKTDHLKMWKDQNFIKIVLKLKTGQTTIGGSSCITVYCLYTSVTAFSPSNSTNKRSTYNLCEFNIHTTHVGIYYSIPLSHHHISQRCLNVHRWNKNNMLRGRTTNFRKSDESTDRRVQLQSSRYWRWQYLIFPI